MNLAGVGGDPNSNLLFVNFNQDCTSLAVGTKSGYKLFSLSSIDKLDNIYESDSEDICIVERLFSSSLVAVVSLSSPRKLKVCHFKKGTEICNYSYSNTILGVRLNRLRLVVCLEESLYIHNIRDMKVLHTIRDTPPNPQGLCALSVSNDNCFLAYPGSNQIGEVQIFDCVNLRAVTMIPAHDNPLAALAFNSLGTKLATASEKGTVIRVFSIPDGQKLFEFRRGVKRCASINSLAFSIPDSLFLSCSSNTETVHIFKLENSKEKPPEDGQGWMGYFGQALKTSSQYLPSQVTEMFNQGRDFAVARLPFAGLKNVSALANIQKRPYLVVGCQDGYLYLYNIDVTEGGECTLVKQHRIDGRQQDQLGVSEPPAGTTPTTGASSQPSATGVGNSYASSLLSHQRDITNNTKGEAIGGGPPSGKNSNEHPYYTKPHQDWGWSGNSYARVLERDPEEQEPFTTEGKIQEAIKNRQESLPYRDIDECTDGGESNIPGIGALRLDDENEFPPMTQKDD